MAYYSCGTFWYRGRRFRATYRYNSFQDVVQERGKPLLLTRRDRNKLERLAMRKPELASSRDWTPDY